MSSNRDEYKEKLFERYVKEELEKNEVDPLEYCYYRESIDFELYMVRESFRELGEELTKSIEEELIKPIEAVFIKWIKH